MPIIRSYSFEGNLYIFGISSHVRPSSNRPLALGVRPPHCLWKKEMLEATHRSRKSRTQSGSHGRAFAPLSPPVITQSILSRLSDGKGPSKGSQERKRIAAGTIRNASARGVNLSFSILVPIQTLAGQDNRWPSRRSRPTRFV